MFCKNCGIKIEDDWRICPNCGMQIKSEEREKEDQNDTQISAKSVAKAKTREEIKKDLESNIVSEKGGVVLCYGSRAISKDLSQVLQPNEEIYSFYHAYRNSLLGYIKSFRMFRNYFVCTNQRLVYVENGNMIFSFLKKQIVVPYKEISQVNVSKRVGIYSGKISFVSNGKKYCFAITSSKEAENLKNYIDSKNKIGGDKNVL